MKGQFEHSSVSVMWLKYSSIKTAGLDRVKKDGVVGWQISWNSHLILVSNYE